MTVYVVTVSRWDDTDVVAVCGHVFDAMAIGPDGMEWKPSYADTSLTASSGNGDYEITEWVVA